MFYYFPPNTKRLITISTWVRILYTGRRPVAGRRCRRRRCSIKVSTLGAHLADAPRFGVQKCTKFTIPFGAAAVVVWVDDGRCGRVKAGRFLLARCSGVIVIHEDSAA